MSEQDTTTPARHPGGRPSKYDPAFCDVVLASLAEGLSLDACAGVIGVARSTIYEWVDAHPEFSDAVKVGQAKSVLFWELKLLRVADRGGGPGTTTAIIFGLKNRAPEAWRERQEHDFTSSDGSMTPPPTTIQLVGVRATHDDGDGPVT